jgi:cytosine permease
LVVGVKGVLVGAGSGRVRGRNLSEVIEDHALESVPAEQRKSGWSLAWSTTGIVTTLVQLAIGSYVTAVAGIGLGVLAGVLVCVFGASLGWLVGHISYKEGLSSTVAGRFYGFGVRGSVIASAIFGFMILGFLAIENVLLYNGTLFAFGWEPNLLNAVAIYGILTVFWILLTTFGINLVTRVSSVLLIAFLILLVYMVFRAATATPIGETLSFGPLIPSLGDNLARFQIALVALAGSAGALALVDADYGRYARTSRDVGILAIAGALAIDILMVVSGTIIIYGSTPIVAEFLVANNGVSPTDAAARASELAAANTGAYFIILSSIFGFILMYAAQAKAQVLNTYSGSLALTNFFDALLGWRPGRFFMVILGNIIGLLMVIGGILGLLQTYLGLLGILTTSFCGIMIADYYIVRRFAAGRARPSDTVDSVNWAGVISITLASVVSFVLAQTGVFALGFLLALAVTLVLYPVLRMWVLKPGAFTRQISMALAAREEIGS